MCIDRDNEITDISCTETGLVMYACNNCGASSPDPLGILHNKGCTPGEGKKWEDFYKNIAEEDADKCPFDGEYCWHFVQGNCIHINGTVPEGKPCSRYPKGGDIHD